MFNQPEVRVVDPESPYLNELYEVQSVNYVIDHVKIRERGKVYFNFDQIQELTPLSHDGVRIGIGDKVTHGSRTVTINGFWVCEESGVVKLHVGKCGSIWETDITDHTPLTEMKKEENKPYQPEKETWEYEPRKDCILCDLEERGGMVHSNVHFSHHDELEKEDNDKPTIERIDRPDPYDRHSDNMVSLDVPEVAAVLIEMFEQQTEILEALADAGLINLSEN